MMRLATQIRHVQVDVLGEVDEARRRPQLAGPPGQELRVQRDAVSADPGPG